MPNITNSSGAPMIWQGVEILPGETKFIQIENATAPSWHTAKPVGWQPIETAPRDGTPFLAALTNGDVVRIYASAHSRARFSWWMGAAERLPIEDTHQGQIAPERLRATHWMPLPAAPKE